MYFSNWRPLALISNISLHPVQPLKMTPLRTSICNHTFPQEYISTVLLSSLYAISENFWVQVWFVLTPHWKERGTYYQITQSAFRWLVDLNYYLLDCFDLIDLSKDLNEYDIFYFPEGFGKNSKLLLRYFNSYNFIPQAYRPGNSLFECPFKRNWNPHVYFPHTLYVNRLGKILRLSGIVHYYNYYILCTFWRCVSNKYKGSCSSELFKFFT